MCWCARHRAHEGVTGQLEELVLSFHLVLLPVPWSWPGSFWVTPTPHLSRSRSAGITARTGFFQVHSNVEKEDIKSCALERPSGWRQGNQGGLWEPGTAIDGTSGLKVDAEKSGQAEHRVRSHCVPDPRGQGKDFSGKGCGQWCHCSWGSKKSDLRQNDKPWPGDAARRFGCSGPRV